MKSSEIHYYSYFLVNYSTCFGQVHYPSSGVSQFRIHATAICHASSVAVCYRGQDSF